MAVKAVRLLSPNWKLGSIDGHVVFHLVRYFCFGFLCLFLPFPGIRTTILICKKDGDKKLIKFWCTLLALWFKALLTWSMFPLSYYVLSSSSRISDLIVNIAAVQFIATIDESLVASLFRLDKSVDEANELYWPEDNETGEARRKNKVEDLAFKI